jgi:type III restriction enzyme
MTDRPSLILNSPYAAPTRHWQPGDGGALVEADGRRPASYEIFDIRNDPRKSTRRTEPLDKVNEIRQRVDAWRAADYPGATAISRRLLEHWRDTTARVHPFYFCQLEAIETLIWWVEGAPEFRQGIFVPGDGGPWERVCSKMATGTGKTLVMGMIVVWQVANALAYPQRKDFSRAIFVVAPGLTVKERLRVLYPGEPGNLYDEFALCPSEALRQQVNRAEILVDNWHALMPLAPPERSVVKKGRESDVAFARRVLGKLATHKNLVVINDEAHHAWRVPADVKLSKKAAADAGIDLDEATRWIEGLDRIHKTRGILRCFDLSATPFAPTGKANAEAGLFGWIVSDFGLNDAIEAGLVKTPRVVVRDDALPDATTLRSKLYHLYRDAEVADDLNRRGAQPHEPLPKLVQDAYTLLGADWRAALADWQAAGHTSPPVLLTVCNRTETAARIEHYFRQGNAHWPELHAPEKTLRVDSQVLDKAEQGEKAASDKDYEAELRTLVDLADLPAQTRERLAGLTKEELLREIVDTIGKRGRAGQDVQNVISVAMLSEGWDAKNVTHILGLRAFTSQLLCEQVIGRGLRRVSYDLDENGRFKPEYVNIFGVPLSVFQEVGAGGTAPEPPKHVTQIEALPERNALEIRWPNVLRIDTVLRPTLVVEWDAVPRLTLNPAQTPIVAEIAPALGGAADMSKVTRIDLELLPETFRLQRLIFRAAQKAFEQTVAGFTGQRDYLAMQLIRLVEQFLAMDKLDIPSLFHQDEARKRILIALNLDAIVQHLMRHVEPQNRERLEPVFDGENPIGSTRAMRTWYSSKTCLPTQKSQISHLLADSSWEQMAANLLEMDPRVVAYAKNDHLGCEISYLWNGVRRRYLPDFLIRLNNGKTLVLEIKGEDSAQNCAKRTALEAWVQAVNARGGFGVWCWDVAFQPARMQDILSRHAD